MNTETATLLETHFEIAFDSPKGVQKLRELILMLAMQGKLVPQDPNDEPASELLLKIEVEKQRLLKEGKIKTPKLLPEIKLEEAPYDLPVTWKWVRLGHLIDLISGQHLLPNEYNEIGIGFSYYTGPADFGEINPNATRWTTVDRSIAIQNDILLTVKGAGVGKTNVLKEERAAISRQLMALRVIGINSDFLLVFLKTIFHELQDLAVGIAIPGIGREDVLLRKFPLPPIAEQHRIVAKIEQLMARCDELETLRNDRNQKRTNVHTAAIDRLLTAKADGDFQTAWTFISNHFSELYSVKENVAELRKAILQLAVMGKLVPQDPTDEPASELLKAIEFEKQRLVKEGKIKQIKVFQETKLEKIPYLIPQGWIWTTLEKLFALVTDGDHQAPPKTDDGIPFLVIGNLNKGRVTLENCRFVPFDYYQALDWGRKPTRNDILYTVTGSYGIPIFIDCDHQFCVQRHVAIFKSVESSPVKYLTYLLKSEYALKYATEVATGIAQKTVPLTGLRKMPISVPPLAEQHRIVAKIDRLMELCDRLDQQIEAAKTKQTELLKSLMAKVGN